jgi:hypothetical protein
MVTPRHRALPVKSSHSSAKTVAPDEQIVGVVAQARVPRIQRASVAGG